MVVALETNIEFLHVETRGFTLGEWKYTIYCLYRSLKLQILQHLPLPKSRPKAFHCKVATVSCSTQFNENFEGVGRGGA